MSRRGSGSRRWLAIRTWSGMSSSWPKASGLSPRETTARCGNGTWPAVNCWAAPSQDSGVLSMAVSPDGWHAVTGAFDGGVRVWDLKEGRELHRFTGHPVGMVHGVAFLPDGKSVLSASGVDKTARRWRLPEGYPGPGTGPGNLTIASAHPGAELPRQAGRQGRAAANRETGPGVAAGPIRARAGRASRGPAARPEMADGGGKGNAGSSGTPGAGCGSVTRLGPHAGRAQRHGPAGGVLASRPARPFSAWL